MASTFAFSDEELLDALTHVHDMSDLSAQRHAATDAAPALALPPAFMSTLGSFPSASADGNADLMHELSRCLDQHEAMMGGVAPGASDDALRRDDETESTSSGSETSSAKAVDAPTKPSRKRRKHELDAMRALATSLETQLSELRKRRNHEQPGANLFWKRVADQLLLDRQRATTENERLREIFQDQVKALKSVQRTLLKSPDLEKLGVVPATRAPELNEISSSETYTRLFEGVESAFQGTESVLEQAGIREATENSRRVNMDMRTEDGRSVMVMQVAESRLLPYDVSSVNEGVWQFLSSSRVVFEPSPADPRKSIFRSCVQFIPEPMNSDQELGTAAKDVGLMTEVAMSVYERTIGYIYECVVAELGAATQC
ncbi:hypothetical protein ATCC90586_009804 [Pythium insidiosum]|nr:hypothetical protein ATCC90586_009804 [Pythium insidiosum]